MENSAQPHGKALLDDFGVGQPRVGHVRVHGVRPVAVGVAPLPPQIVS